MITATAITTGLCEVLKQTFPQTKPYMRIVALIVGAAVAYFAGLRNLDLLLVGLSSQGLYSVVEKPVRTTVTKLTK